MNQGAHGTGRGPVPRAPGARPRHIKGREGGVAWSPRSYFFFPWSATACMAFLTFSGSPR